VSDTLRAEFTRLGQRLAADFALVGLFGVDALVVGDSVRPVEINPRYPASAEVLERTLGVATIACHVEACRDGRLPQSAPPVPRCVAGKAIVFARADVRVPEALCEWADTQNSGTWPAVADIPDSGHRVAAGVPILTVLAEGVDEPAVEIALRQRAAEVESLLALHADR
jgi:predicted ATP-grasp superfamily ATP-dependent carboligase